MTRLFELTTISSMKINNRFVRSATWEGLADQNGGVTSKLTGMMVNLAKGGVGLIISSYAFVSPEGKTNEGQIGVHNDSMVPGLTDMVKAVHDAGGKIALQIVHGGLFSTPALTGLEMIGPSEGDKDSKPQSRSMTKQDIEKVIADFTNAAVRAQKAGFDSIQLHAAHGFLLSEFLSPAFNMRDDEYGGSLEKRARLLLEVTESVRKAVGPEYPILVKLNAGDFLANGLTAEDAVRVSEMLEIATVNAIEFSGGTGVSPQDLIPPRPGVLATKEKEVYYRETAKQYKKRVNIPLMLVGGIRSYEVADELIESGTTDYISLARPLVCEPGLVNRWKNGDLRRAECVSDNKCFGPARDGRGLYCVTWEDK